MTFPRLPLLAAALALTSYAVRAAETLDRYNVVWTTPSTDSSGSMPLGNGDIALNAWVDEKGDLVFYISKTDAWTEVNRLVKLGRVRVSLSPNPFSNGGSLTQTLILADGSISVKFTNGPRQTSLRLWVDANRPVINVEGSGSEAFAMTAALEVWRTEKRGITGDEASSRLGVQNMAAESGDVVLPTTDHNVVWYHRNEASWYPINIARNQLEAMPDLPPDPLLNLTFGGLMHGEGFRSTAPNTLQSTPARSHRLAIVALTKQTPTADDWVNAVRKLADESLKTPVETARRESRKHWDDFWSKSFVRFRTPEVDPVPPAALQVNRQPLKLGVPWATDPKRPADFSGGLACLRVSGAALDPTEMARRANGIDTQAKGGDLIADWRFNSTGPKFIPVAGDRSLVATLQGSVAPRDGGIQFNAGSDLTIPSAEALSFGASFTIESWVHLEEGQGGCLLDKSPFPDKRPQRLQIVIDGKTRVPRFRIGARETSTQSAVPTGAWTHLAFVYDKTTAQQRIYINGRLMSEVSATYTPDLAAQQWHLQRFVNAAAGRGSFPIKFNGSIFTFDTPGFNADFRRWGGAYWFQNTRLIYWPMLASGDYQMMLPLFEMYEKALPLARYRSKHYYGIDGAYFPETMTSWGTYNDGDYSGDPKTKKPGEIGNAWIRNYYSSNLELVAMMLDYHQHTQDDAFLKKTLIPMAGKIMAFYEGRTKRDENGKLLFDPSQALETWQKAINPANEIAGLLHCLPRLIALPGLESPLQSRWSKLLELTPALPESTGKDGKPYLSPAAKTLEPAKNSENPELYAVFPFRLYGLERPGLEMARRTFARRHNTGAFSWQQNDLQAALLGLTDDAARMVLRRNRETYYRFPAFWNPGNDWMPDQCSASNFINSLQLMLMQEVDGKILVLPSWPADWDAHFKLHASKNTTVEAKYLGGKLVDLKVTPDSEKVRVKVMTPAVTQ